MRQALLSQILAARDQIEVTRSNFPPNSIRLTAFRPCGMVVLMRRHAANSFSADLYRSGRSCSRGIPNFSSIVTICLSGILFHFSTAECERRPRPSASFLHPPTRFLSSDGFIIGNVPDRDILCQLVLCLLETRDVSKSVMVSQ